MEDQVQVVNRVFAILECLSVSNQPKGPTEISKELGIHKSTVHRLLSSMQQNGYIEKTSAGTYYIGIKLVEIVSNHIDNLELQTEARPFLHDLNSDLGLIVHLGILNHHEVVYIEKIEIERNIRLYHQIGLRVPAACSSLGKCLLSCLSGDDLTELFYNHPLEQYTPNTITRLEPLKKHLQEVRQQGWAMDNEEYILGHRCIAAPIFDYRGDAIAAISASGPISLIPDKRIPEIIDKVKDTAKRISRRLCYQGYE